MHQQGIYFVRMKSHPKKEGKADLLLSVLLVLWGLQFCYFDQADIPVTCATNFTWTPGATVSNVSIPNPILTPTETTRYSVTVLDKYGCSSADTLLVTVIDPADLDCRSIFLPKAFTPNDDNLNDVYGISNPQALRGGLKAFEIFDRWGERVFATGNAFDTWDGTFKGQPINGNVFVYRITYTCDGQEYNDSGTLTLMK